MNNHPLPLNSETLERLLTDQALGTLDCDVEALLSAYLTFEPQARSAHGRIARTVELAREALRPAKLEGEESLPPLRAFDARGSSWRPGKVVAAAAALAACLVLGFALGHSGRQGLPPVPVAREIAQPAAHVPEASASESAKAGSDFWSLRRLYESAKNAPERKPSGVTWKSPFGKPELGGQT